MKINCGPSPEQRKKARIARLTEWHPFFAILPRRTGENDCRWFEWIERKGRPHCEYFDCGQFVWQYRARVAA